MESLTRRSILKGGVALAATASVGITNALRAEPLVSVPGIQLFTVDKELKADVEGTLKKVREIGYGEVETAGLEGYSPQQFRTALANAGLKCRSSHFFDIGMREPNQIFEAANTFGVHYIVSSGISRFTDKPAGTYFRRYPNRYRMAHIKDFVQPAQPSTSLAPIGCSSGTALGTGYIDYRPVLKGESCRGRALLCGTGAAIHRDDGFQGGYQRFCVRSRIIRLTDDVRVTDKQVRKSGSQHVTGTKMKLLRYASNRHQRIRKQGR